MAKVYNDEQIKRAFKEFKDRSDAKYQDKITAQSEHDALEEKANKVSDFQTTPDDTHYPSEKLVKDCLDLKIDSSSKGIAGGVATLDGNGLVPVSQLPIPDPSTLQTKDNLRTSWQSEPDNNHYPSEKLVYDQLALKANISTLTNDYATKVELQNAISANAATFRGAYYLIHFDGEGLPDLGFDNINPTHEQVGAAIKTKLASLSTPIIPENNDYVFVQIPVANDNPSVVSRVDRYKCISIVDSNSTDDVWVFEYSLNNSGFTAAQWEAINSAITSTQVSNYNDHLTNTSNPHSVTAAQVGLGNVENKSVSTIKSEITGSVESDNEGFVTGGDVYNEINEKASYYITRNSSGNPFETYAQLTNTNIYYSGGSVRVPTQNDYAIVLQDETQSTLTTDYDQFSSVDDYINKWIINTSSNILVKVTSSNKNNLGINPGVTKCWDEEPKTISCYGYNNLFINQWVFQYSINRSTLFTSDQLAAINSGITSTLVGNYNTHVADTTIHVTSADKTYWNSKQSDLCVNITYSQFVSKITNSQLVPGMKYRITDYVTTCDGVYDLSSVIGQTAYLPYATSAEHPFDLIVEATGINTYNENVKAALPTNEDGHFGNNNISAWELKWTHLNDKTKYSWADATYGKGVIYYMKDEFENEAFYDFKNIMNLQFALRRVDTSSSVGHTFEYNTISPLQLNRYGSIGDVFTVLQGGSIGYNLEFDVGDLGGTSLINLLVFITDVRKSTLDSAMDWTYMLMGLSQQMETTVTLDTLAYLLNIPKATLEAMTERQVLQMFFNAEFYYTFDLYDDSDATPVHLDFSFDGARCQSNKIGHCSDVLTTYLSLNGVSGINIINNGLPLITFESYNDTNNNIQLINYGNELGMNSFLNVFGCDCYSNKVGDYFYLNKCATQFSNNVLGTDCFSNVFEQAFGNNTLLTDCYFNYFGMGVNGNSFGCFCTNNHFSWNVQYNTFGNNCNHNNLDSEILYSIFENGVQHITLTSGTSGSDHNQLQYVKICQGVAGDENNQITISATRNLNYQVTYKMTGSTEVSL